MSGDSGRPNPVLAELVDDGHGELSYRGGRYLLIRPETLVALQRALEALVGDRAGECLVTGGRAGGGRATRDLAGDARERAERLVRMGTAIGWGEFALELFMPRTFVVTVRRSPFAVAYGPSSGPVCHLIRGVLESLAAAVLDGPARVTETACAAAGAPTCRFVADARPR